MTKEDILQRCTWDRYNMAALDIEIPILKINTKVQFIPELKSGKEITEDMTKALNDVLSLSTNQIVEIKNLLFWYFNLCCETTSYGFDIDITKEETKADANKRYFDVKNEEDTWIKSKLELITILEDEGRAAMLNFDVPWDDEHGCEIKLVNGKIIGFEEQ
ncbi:MAG: DUF6985 domain-containing protein [Flavobacterium sp.]